MDYGPDYNRSNYVMPSPSTTPSTSTSSSSSKSTDDGVKGRGAKNAEVENKGSDSDMFGRAVIEPPASQPRLTVPATPSTPSATPVPVPPSVRAPASLTTASASMFDALIGNSQAPTEGNC